MVIATGGNAVYSSTVPIEKKLHLYLFFKGHNPLLAEIDDHFAIASPMRIIMEMVDLINEYLFNVHTDMLETINSQVLLNIVPALIDI